MRRGPKLEELSLTMHENNQLVEWARRGSTAQALALRARIVLAAAQGLPSREVARRTRVTAQTVGKWRRRFIARRLDGLLDEPRPGAPRRIGDAKVEALITKTLHEKPRNATHWNSRAMAKAMGVSQTSVVRVWRAFGLQPHRQETFKLSADPLFIDKVRDIVGLYLDPPVKAMVLCVDEKSQIQALDRTQPLLPLRPGIPARQTHDYKRHGTTTLFAALNMLDGKVIGECLPRHRGKEFVRFLKTIDAQTPGDLDLHLIVDNYSTHKSPPVNRWLAKHKRFRLHFIPTSSSWLNMVERWFGQITQKRIRRGTFKSVPQLIDAIMEYLNKNNSDPKPFVWTKDAAAILGKERRALDLLEAVKAGTKR
ncbi:MAG: IS630 family transposase [Nevskiales bacterium]